jgi:hypothetical protein
VITWVFLIWIIGSALIWALASLLNDGQQETQYSQISQNEPHDDVNERSTSPPATTTEVNFSQVISFTGYSLLPHVFMVLIVFVLGILPFMDTTPLSLASLILKSVAIAWSARVCLHFVAKLIQ